MKNFNLKQFLTFGLYRKLATTTSLNLQCQCQWPTMTSSELGVIYNYHQKKKNSYNERKKKLIVPTIKLDGRNRK